MGSFILRFFFTIDALILTILKTIYFSAVKGSVFLFYFYLLLKTVSQKSYFSLFLNANFVEVLTVSVLKYYKT